VPWQTKILRSYQEREGQNKMPKLIFVIGATATGKSYFIQQKYAKKGIELFDIYDYQQRVYDEAGVKETVSHGKQIRCLMKANALLFGEVLESLKKGHDVAKEKL